MTQHTEVLVIGGGHAGCEAALAAARLGCDTTLVTGKLSEIAKAPCNPAMGGPGKAQLMREVDALGGEIARVTDRAMINVRMLNTGKGPAMYALRAVIDRDAYKVEMQNVLASTDNLNLVEGFVEKLCWDQEHITGVELANGDVINADTVIVTTGTFLRGRCHRGSDSFDAGREGEPPAVGLSHSLLEAGLKLGRLNTGTTPRIRRDSINFEGMDAQPTADEPLAFSYLSEPSVLEKDFTVYLTRSNAETHQTLREAFELNPGKNGTLGGEGPRYCPSIETKILRFPERTSHIIFLEPEGADTDHFYMGGFATSSPPEVQDAAIRCIPGLENAEVAVYGYDVEYDFAYPTQLKPSLETKVLDGLFLAGQINGTTGYEEAAAQGLMAGVNAVHKVRQKEPLVLQRTEAFIGVMIDDLVTRGTEEPYRMLPSRAEYRLLLRQGNADLRLTPKGREIGLVDDVRYEKFCARRDQIESELNRLKTTRIKRNGNAQLLEEHGVEPGASLFQLLKRPEFEYVMLLPFDLERNGTPLDVAEELDISAKYEGYIQRHQNQIERLQRLEEKRIPTNYQYDDLSNISSEGREKFKLVQPETLGQAARIPGVSQADLASLMIYLKK
jgi:tRNA uridine 5-carboxymethylaminomethyl modification enzyme